MGSDRLFSVVQHTMLQKPPELIGMIQYVDEFGE